VGQNDSSEHFIKLLYSPAINLTQAIKRVFLEYFFTTGSQVCLFFSSRLYKCKYKCKYINGQGTCTLTRGGSDHATALTFIVRMKLGLQLLHLPLVPQQGPVLLQRAHPFLLLFLRHLLDDRVLLVVCDSFNKKRGGRKREREREGRVFFPPLHFCHEVGKRRLQAPQRKCKS